MSENMFVPWLDGASALLYKSKALCVHADQSATARKAYRDPTRYIGSPIRNMAAKVSKKERRRRRAEAAIMGNERRWLTRG